MVRDDLYITIPSFFRCPISLDVMKSPVSLCTGVTYDRASIQRWLDSGNNTCPATMQVLQSKEFVPNRTLQRLIQIWSDSAESASARSADSVSSAAVSVAPSAAVAIAFASKEQIRDMIKGMKGKGEKWPELLDVIVRFARKSEENREFLAKTDGFIDVTIDFLSNSDDENEVKLDELERVVVVLNMALSKLQEQDRELLANLILKSNRSCLSSLLSVLQNGSEESRIGSIKILEFMSFDAESKLLIAEKEGLIGGLIRIIVDGTETEVVEASLSCLISVSVPKRTKLKLVQHKLIPGLRRMLMVDQNSRNSISEKSLKLLEMMSSVKEGRAEICEDARCVQAVVRKVMKVSAEATEHAVTILWSVCYLFRDQRAQEEVTKSNGLTKILLLMQSNCSPAVRHMCTDLLKIFRINSKSCLSTYDTKTTHIMPF